MSSQELKSSPGTPKRVRVSVPAADVSTLEWLKRQNDMSASIRALIRESIEREGYVDVYNRPLVQRPRIGRPPSSGSVSNDDESNERDAVPEVVREAAAKAQQPIQLQPQESAEADEVPTPRPVKKKPAPASEPIEEHEGEESPQEAEEAETEDSQPQHRQLDMNAVMASTRREPQDQDSSQPSVDDIMRSTRR